MLTVVCAGPEDHWDVEENGHLHSRPRPATADNILCANIREHAPWRDFQDSKTTTIRWTGTTTFVLRTDRKTATAAPPIGESTTEGNRPETPAQGTNREALMHQNTGEHDPTPPPMAADTPLHPPSSTGEEPEPPEQKITGIVPEHQQVRLVSAAGSMISSSGAHLTLGGALCRAQLVGVGCWTCAAGFRITTTGLSICSTWCVTPAADALAGGVVILDGLVLPKQWRRHCRPWLLASEGEAVKTRKQARPLFESRS